MKLLTDMAPLVRPCRVELHLALPLREAMSLGTAMCGALRLLGLMWLWASRLPPGSIRCRLCSWMTPRTWTSDRCASAPHARLQNCRSAGQSAYEPLWNIMPNHTIYPGRWQWAVVMRGC